MQLENAKGTTKDIADNYANNSPHFWSEIKYRIYSKVKLPTNVDGIYGEVNIGSMLSNHYDTVFNSIAASTSRHYHTDMANRDIDMCDGMNVGGPTCRRD